MHSYKTIIILLFVSAVSFGQDAVLNLDSLANEFINLFNENYKTEKVDDDLHHHKCGFQTSIEVQLNWENFTSSQKNLLSPYLQRPVLDTSIVSPSGYFRIHYSFAFSTSPKYDVQQFAEALDSAYNFEVNYLGFPPPPSDMGEGGDNKYDVYIMPLSAYGLTRMENEISPGSNKYTTYIIVHNSFTGFYTTGINAARVTAAHEFHHAIQIGNYIVRGQGSNILDMFFYEMTSTAMEEFVYDDVNDYYGYMSSYFNNPGRSFSLNNGYNLAIWLIFLQKKYGFEIIKRQWEFFVNYRALQAIDLSLGEVNNFFTNALREFGLWTFITNYRSVQGGYFEEAEKYPLLKPMMTSILPAAGTVYTVSSSYAANNWLQITYQSDSIFVLVTNGDVEKGINNTSFTSSFDYGLFTSPVSGSAVLNDKYFYKFNPSVSEFWGASAIINNVVYGDTNIIFVKQDFPFPSPFIPKKNLVVNLPVNDPRIITVELGIFSISGERIFYNELRTSLVNGKRVVAWNGKNQNGLSASTGIYFYYLKSGNYTDKGKITLINE